MQPVAGRSVLGQFGTRLGVFGDTRSELELNHFVSLILVHGLPLMLLEYFSLAEELLNAIVMLAREFKGAFWASVLGKALGFGQG